MSALPRLITIPLSHYCERARWALDHCEVPYVEDQHLQMFHIRHVKRAGGRHTVPLLVTPDGPLTDSRDIVAYAHAHASPGRGLYPDDAAERETVEALEADFAGSFGVEARRWAYHRLLPHRKLVSDFNGAEAPWHERVALRLGYRFAEREVRRYLKINDDTVEAGRPVIDACFERVADRLRDGRPYLFGDRITAADITFAALAAVLVAPPEYGARQRGIRLPGADEVPEGMAREVSVFREHPAGAFALRVYRDARRPAPG